MVAYCVQWLNLATPIKRASNGVYSYTGKHVVEECAGHYISNGAFIAAALSMDLLCTQEKNSPNAVIGVSQKGVR